MGRRLFNVCEYVTAHPECATSLLKYMHTVRFGPSRTNLDWKEYDFQFRLKKELSPSICFASVAMDNELWLIFMHQSLQSLFGCQIPDHLSAMTSITRIFVRGTIAFTTTNVSIVTRISYKMFC